PTFPSAEKKSLKEPDGPPNFPAHSGSVPVNLSAPSCAIKTAKALREGDYLELRMLIPDQATPLAIDLAKVRWEHNGHFGLQFIRMRPDDQDRLATLLKTPS
ncbi:MAG: PilZ domain-containing protein, partial [Nitrospiraceae bacterium]